MQLEIDGQPVRDDVCEESIRDALRHAHATSESNISLTSTDGAYLAVSLGVDVELQLMTADHPRAAVQVCTRPPGPDELAELFLRFYRQEEGWRGPHPWKFSQEATSRAAQRRTGSCLGKLRTLYLLSIPLVAGATFFGSDGTLSTRLVHAAALAWVMAVFVPILQLTAWFNFKLDFFEQARLYTERSLGVKLRAVQNAGLVYSNPWYNGRAFWRVEGDASDRTRTMVYLYMIATVAINLFFGVLVGAILLGLPLYGFQQLAPV